MNKLLANRLKKDIKIRMQNDNRSIRRIIPRVKTINRINKIRFTSKFPWSIK